MPTPPPSPIAQPSSPPQQQQQPLQPTTISMDLLNSLLETCTALTMRVENLEQDKIAQALEITRGIIAYIDADKDVTLEEVEVEKNADVQRRLEESQAKVYHIDLKHADKVLITAATTTITTVATITTAPTAARRRKGAMIRDPEETTAPSIIIHTEPKSKDKGKGIMNMVGFKMDYFKGMSYDAIRPIFEKYFNSNVDFLEKSKEQLKEEKSRALKKQSESLEEKAVKKQKLDEELGVEKTSTNKNNKPFYKIIRADGSRQLFLSFLSLLRNFDREDLEMLWQLVKERFASSKPKNVSDDLLLTTLTYMFEKHDVEAQMILLVERRYPLTRFTFKQILNNVRLEVKEFSKSKLDRFSKVKLDQFPKNELDRFSTVKLDRFPKNELDQFLNIELDGFSLIELDRFSKVKLDRFPKNELDRFSLIELDQFSLIELDRFSLIKLDRFLKSELDRFLNVKLDRFPKNELDRFSKVKLDWFPKNELDRFLKIGLDRFSEKAC
nr:hypothetical protein [Tanacetum cinerariifolium]